MRHLGLLVLRLILGGIFVIHGYPKFFGGPGKKETLPPGLLRHLGEGFVAQMDRGSLGGYRESMMRAGVPLPGVMGTISAASQLGGGALLMLGWLTRPAALSLAVNMVIAIWRVHWSKGMVGRMGYEFCLALLAGCLALLFGGPGALSIDGEE
jgi:putative oxidoreductase